MKILFVQGKGGVGKSTLAFLFAVTLHKAGKAISVTDIDPQKSLTAWLAETDGFIPKEDGAGEVTIIDTPPRIDDLAVIEAIKKADRIIIPTTPSPAEIATLRHSTSVVQSIMKKTAKAFVVFNRVKKSSTYGKNLASLSQQLSLPVAKNFITDREVYKHVLLDGWPELDSQAKEEVMNLALEIQ
jgi:chromosome partitioning protein